MRISSLYPLILLLLYSLDTIAQKSGSENKIIQGRVYDEHEQPISYASVTVEGYNISTLTNEKGFFKLHIPSFVQQYSIRISFLGKKTLEKEFSNHSSGIELKFVLQDNSLTLDSISVNASYSKSSNSISSIIFDEEAIERVQAFSLMDVLNTLPGKQMKAPNINAPQTLTLRNTLTDVHSLNNSLGIPIIMDGVNISNDANMQSRPIGQWGMLSGALPATRNANTSDVPFRGIDLREIPVESIERIEVIQGVASAEYGELTDGAILIEKKAGKSPWYFTTNVNGTAYNYSLNKGFNLPKKMGGITMDANYALSNSEPTTNFQEYRRYGFGIRWNTTQYKRFRNRLSLDYNNKIDEGKLDPDDNERLRYYATDKGFRFSNTATLNFFKGFVNNVSLMTSLSVRDQDSYGQRLLNQGTKMIGNKDTTGIYEGIVLPTSYVTVEEIIGKPMIAAANLKLNSNFRYLNSSHFLSYGLNANYNNNGGKGIISDPNLPRFVNHNNQNARPYAFELTPAMISYGFYFSDNVHYSLFGKRWSSNLGFRIDSQNKSISLQPRLSTQVALNRKINLAAAYGVSTKTPTLAQVYPTPSWIDIGLLTAGSSRYDPVYLVYTQRMETTNLNLKPMRNSQAEVNFNYTDKGFSTRINAFYKSLKDGFNSYNTYIPMVVPVYKSYSDDDLQKIVYYPTGENKVINDVSYNTIQNIQNSNTYGFDWSVALPTIPIINTSISTSTSYIISKENPIGIYDDIYLKSPVEYGDNNIWHILYERESKNRRYILTSKLNTTTHIPKIGFVVMTNTDFFWRNNYGSLHKETYQSAVGYLDQNMQVVILDGIDDPSLPPRNIRLTGTAQEMVYANFSMSVAKEISKKVRIAITTYNTFNIRPQYRYNDGGVEKITVYNSPISITGGINIKL